MYRLIDEKTTYIGENVTIGEGCIIYPNVMIIGETVIGENTTIYLGSYIEDSTIGKGNTIYTSYIMNSTIGDNNLIGPYANVRPGNIIGNNNKVGAFVEVKKTEIKNNVQIPHLSCVNDSIVEDNVNIGAGVKIANWDGKRYHTAVIKEDSFIGCNSVLVSPVTLHKKSFVAAGSTITDDVPENTLAIARERQINKERKINKE